jgi:hypothetical protein
VLLCLWSPLPDSSLAGQEHGRTIPLGDIAAALQKNRAGPTIPDDADLSHLRGSRRAILEPMLGLRKLLRARRSGSLLALTVAYSLAVQAMMASVGLSMSAPDQGGHVICSFTSGPSAHPPATSGDRQNPGPQPHCRSRLRQFIFGGTTQYILSNATLPVLMAH